MLKNWGKGKFEDLHPPVGGLGPLTEAATLRRIKNCVIKNLILNKN